MRKRTQGDGSGPDAGRLRILDCPVDNVSMDEALQRCLAWVREGKGGNHVVTINAFGVMLMRENGRMRESVLDAALVVPDGGSILLAARLLGRPLGERVTGVDLTRALFTAGHVQPLRFFFLGAAQDVVEKTAVDVEAAYPGVTVAGRRHGFFSPAEEDAIVEEIREASADILLVALPNPRAEEWIHRHKAALGVPVIIGVGGTFDVLAGKIRRAPVLIQRLYLEWLWRFLLEPRKRWKTNLVYNPLFALSILHQRVQESIGSARMR